MIHLLFNRERWQQGIAIGLAGTAAVLLLRWAGIFTQLRLQVTDVYFVTTPVSDEITIIALDDNSLQRFGRTPAEWSRQIFVDMLAALEPVEPRVIAFDVLLSEPTPNDDNLAEALQNARETDARTRIVLPAVGVPPAQQSNRPDYPQAIRFDTQLKPVASLSAAVDYVGYVNTFPDADGSIRRQPTIIQVDDGVNPAFSIAVYLAYLRIPSAVWTQVSHAQDDELQVTPQRALQIDDFGFWQQNYFGPPFKLDQQTYPVVPLVDVLDGEFDSEIFRDKIVLIGLINSTGITDQYPVPSATQGQLMAGVEIQAHAVETLLQNRSLHTPPRPVHYVMIVLTALFSSVLYVGLRWYFKFAVVLLLLVIGAGFTFALFARYAIVASLLDGILALTLPFLLSLGQDTITEINRRRKSEFLLGSMSQAAQQRLVIDRILPIIATDVQYIIPQAIVRIWIHSIASQSLSIAFQTHADDHSSLPESVNQAQQTQTTVLQKSQLAIPFVWQQQTIGVLFVEPLRGISFGRKTIALLQDLVQELAPTIANAMLFTETERQRLILETVVAGSPNNILVLDENYCIQQMSNTFDRTFDIRAANYAGQPVIHILKAINMGTKNQQQIEAVLKAQKQFSQEVTIKDQTLILDMVPLEPIHWWVVTLTNVSYLVHLNQLKTNMVRMLSHDLGNPLARIVGYTALLVSQPEEFSESQLQFLNYILDDGNEMNDIIEDVMKLDQLRSAEVSFEKVDFGEIIESVAKQFAIEVADNQQNLIVDLNADSSFILMGHYRQLMQMVSNLVGNAIKYTPATGCISVRLKHQDSYLLLEVADNGYGIPVEAQSQLFDEFYRVRTEAMGVIKGHGLGLSLVKAIVEGHRGRVWLESEEGVGSHFYVQLPTG